MLSRCVEPKLVKLNEPISSEFLFLERTAHLELREYRVLGVSWWQRPAGPSIGLTGGQAAERGD